MDTAFDRLDPKLREWVWRRGWKDLNTLQRNAVAPILRRDTDVILSAPTAGGKTEAAFLPILTDLLAQRDGAGTGAESVPSTVLAVSPLKALINDQVRRLEEMTEGTGIPVTAWHGDAAQSRKNAVLEHPGGIVVITPESLEAMLTLRPQRAEKLVASLRYIVIDELHSFLDSERGIQLQSLLQRLGRPEVPRIALSATLGSRENASRFLRPNGELPVAVPESGERETDARIAVKEYIATDRQLPEEAIAGDLFARLRGSNNLVFTNSRKDAEAYMVALTRLSEQEHVPNEFRIHHGSLSREDRHAVEKDLQRGGTPVTAICTASMELGVDIGSVASVAQIGTAGSPSAMRQRLGRSGRRGAPPVLRVYSVDEARDDYKFHLRSNLVQNIAVTELLRAGEFDPAPAGDSFISIAVQQLLGLLGQYGSLQPASAYSMLCGKGPFGMLRPDDFASLLKHLHARKIISQLGTGALVIGEEGERLVGKRDFLSAFTAAPDYTIIDNATRKSIGSVQYKPYYGEVFILGGRTWIVDGVEEKSSSVYVGRTESKGKMMFEGTGPETSERVTQKMREVLASDESYVYLDPVTGAPQQLDEARRWFRKRGLDTQPWLLQADRLAYMTWGGMRANRTLALMANAELGLSLQYDHLAVQGLSEENVEVLRGIMPSSPQEREEYLASLAAHVNRRKKERGKFDAYLPDSLLDRQYAARKLQLPDLKV